MTDMSWALADRRGQARAGLTALLVIAAAAAIGVWLGIPSLGWWAHHESQVEVHMRAPALPDVPAIEVPDVEPPVEQEDIEISERRIRIRSSDADPVAEPLVWIDGVFFEGDLSAINPDRIDRIEVLKGEAARSVHGPAAEHGVIKIYLKKPEDDGARP